MGEDFGEAAHEGGFFGGGFGGERVEEAECGDEDVVEVGALLEFACGAAGGGVPREEGGEEGVEEGTWEGAGAEVVVVWGGGGGGGGEEAAVG